MTREDIEKHLPTSCQLMSSGMLWAMGHEIAEAMKALADVENLDLIPEADLDQAKLEARAIMLKAISASKDMPQYVPPQVKDALYFLTPEEIRLAGNLGFSRMLDEYLEKQN